MIVHRTLCVVSCALVLLACSEPPKHLSFTPDDGEQRRYQMFSETYIEATSSFGSDSDRIRSHMIIDYDVTEQASSYAVLARPQYLWTRFRNGSFSSVDAPDYRQKKLWSLLEAGITTEIDKQSGLVHDVIVHHDMAGMEDAGFDPIRQLLQDELSRPGFSNGIELRLGAVQQVAAADELPDMTLTVESLNAKQVGLSIQGENNEVKLYGHMLLERDSGWLIRSAIVIEMPLPHEFAKGRVRIVASVMPADWKFGQDLEFLESASHRLPADTSALPDTLEALSMATEEQVFPAGHGSIEHFGDKLTLQYTHDVFDYEPLGHFKLSDLQARDSAGNPIDIRFHHVGAFSYRFSETAPMNTGVDIYPLGWRDMVPKLEQVAYIEATLTRFPVTHTIVHLPIKDSETVVEHHGARAILTPTGQQGEYRLKREHSEHAYFGMTIDGPDAGSMEHDKTSVAPAWLEDSESRLLQVVGRGYFPITHTLYFEGDVPKEIRLLAHRNETQVLQEKQVRFYNPDAVFNDIELEPLKSMHLFLQSDDYSFTGLDVWHFEARDVQDIVPQDFDRPQLYMVLSQEQAALCELEQTADINEAGRKLVWLPRDPRQQYIQYESRLPREVVFQLATEDGIRDFFYQHEVTVRMHCTGRPEWQPLDIELGEQSWLISVADLLGHDWRDEFADMSLLELLRRFRFEDTQQKALSLVPPPDFDSRRRPVLANMNLLDFVTADGRLRVAGRVASVQKLEASGERIIREWSHQFPALPSAIAVSSD